MQSYVNYLLFPTIKYCPALPSTLDQKYKLYRLDWDITEAIKEKRWVDKAECSPAPIFPGSIPGVYKDWVDTMLFASPQSVIEEIKTCTFKAIEEISRNSPRLKWEPTGNISPTSAYIQKAFHLIADSLYDPEINNFSRDPHKAIVPSVLLYRFWCHQLKPELLMQYTKIYDLKRNVGDVAEFLPDPQDYIEFFNNMAMHLQRVQKPKQEKSPKDALDFLFGKKQNIESGTLLDFLAHKKSIVFIDDAVIELPNNDIINLSKPQIARSKNGIFLNAELTSSTGVQYVINRIQAKMPVTFHIKDSTCILEVFNAEIINLCETPPPTVCIKFNTITIKASTNNKIQIE